MLSVYTCTSAFNINLFLLDLYILIIVCLVAPFVQKNLTFPSKTKGTEASMAGSVCGYIYQDTVRCPDVKKVLVLGGPLWCSSAGYTRGIAS